QGRRSACKPHGYFRPGALATNAFGGDRSKDRRFFGPCLLASLLMVCLLPAGLARAQATGEGLRFATGQVGGTYHGLGEVIRNAIIEGPVGIVNVELVKTPGSVGSVHLLAKGEVEFALAQADVVYHAARKKTVANADKVLRAVAAVMTETVHILVRKDAGVVEFQDLAFAEKISVGLPGSGSASSFLDLLKAHGMQPDEVQRSYLTDKVAAERLIAGELSAWVTTAAAPSKSVEKVLKSGQATLLPIKESVLARLNEQSPALRPGEIAKGVYPGLEESVLVPVVKTLLLTRKDVPVVKVHEMLRVLTSEAEALAAVHPAAGKLDAAQMAADLIVAPHEGAVGVFESHDETLLPVKVNIGIFVFDVSNLDFKTGRFEVTFSLWFRWKGDYIELTDSGFPFEVVNGTVTTLDGPEIERFGSWSYVYYKVTASMRGHFPLHQYPFDVQSLQVQVESNYLREDEVVFVPDEHEEGALLTRCVDKSARISDWTITGAQHAVLSKDYPTNFGSPIDEAAGVKSYSRYAFEVSLRRSITPYIVKFVVPLVVIVLMSFTVFFVDPKEFAVQAGIVIIALLSCVAFHLFQADALPGVGYLVTADKFFLIAYVVIFLALVEVVAENRFYHKGELKRAETLDRISRYVFPVLFFGPLLYLIITSQMR
ncbi:TAXI family TRAP transporter solute-binding subunit, partial [Planctomycetota bacterium]